MIKHNYTIICDDVRQEVSNKLIIIGVYMDGKLGVPQIPFVLPTLCFHMSLESDRPGNWGLRLKVQHLETGKNILEGMGQIGFQRPGPGVNQVRLGALTITAAGVYNFIVEIQDQKEPIIVPFEVVLNLQQAGMQQPGLG